MRTTIQNYTGGQLEIETYFYKIFKGRGAWTVNCEVSYKDHKKMFHGHTTDSMFVDKISDMQADGTSWNEIQEAIKKNFSTAWRRVF